MNGETLITGLLGALGGGFGLKLLDYFTSGASWRRDELAAYREDLNKKIDEQEVKIEVLERRFEDISNKYHELQMEHVKLQVKYDLLVGEHEKLKQVLRENNIGDMP